MQQLKIEDFVIGTKFKTYNSQYIVTSREDADKARIAAGAAQLTTPDCEVAFYCIKIDTSMGHLWKKNQAHTLFTESTTILDDARTISRKHKFIEDKEKASYKPFDSYNCPKCNQKTQGYVALVEQSFICTACNQATLISELNTLSCGHRGKRYEWWSAQTGIRSGCYDCRLREEAFED